MENKKLKIGIFGARMGTAHARTLNAMTDLVEITALCEKNTELHSKFDEILAPGGKCYTDFDEFINSGLDAVVLANYFDEHAKYAIKAFEAGVDVLSAEPAKEDNPLLTCENCIITPHIAWASLEARTRLMNIFRSNVEGFVNGKPINVIN